MPQKIFAYHSTDTLIMIHIHTYIYLKEKHTCTPACEIFICLFLAMHVRDYADTSSHTIWSHFRISDACQVEVQLADGGDNYKQNADM